MGLGGVHRVVPAFSREPKTDGVGGVLALAAVIDEVEVAIVQLGHARRMLVRPGRDLGTEDALSILNSPAAATTAIAGHQDHPQEQAFRPANRHGVTPRRRR